MPLYYRFKYMLKILDQIVDIALFIDYKRAYSSSRLFTLKLQWATYKYEIVYSIYILK